MPADEATSRSARAGGHHGGGAGSTIRVARPNTDDDHAGIEEYLERIRLVREAGDRERAEQEQRQRALVAAVLPASTTLAEIFKQVERTTRSIRAQRCHEVVVVMHQPRPECVIASLRWGKKLALEDADKQLMHSYRRGASRLRRYPEVLVAWEYFELSGVFDSCARTLELGSGEVMPIERFVSEPSMVKPYIAATLPYPVVSACHYLRSNGYTAPSTSP